MFNFTSDFNLSDYTLIIPSVSVGNIPQLTVDLLITTYKLKKIATIWHPAIVASVGGDPYESNASEICTACELYANEEFKIATIQLRSTLIQKLSIQFFAELRNSLVKMNLKRIVLLCSAFDYELHTVTSEKFFYTSNECVKDVMESMQIKQIVYDGNERIVSGFGYASKLFDVLNEDMKCVILVKYASEGDNRPDALMMLDKLLKFVGLRKENVTNLTFPTSWEYFFGGPPPIGIY